MRTDPAIVIAWLLLAHLLADFVFQTRHMAVDKFGHGPRAWNALLSHVAVVALSLVPVVAIFGIPGLLFLVVSTLAHLVIDRAKIVLTRGAEASAIHAARASDAPEASAATLGGAWTPIPGALFIADQLAHLVVLFLAWLAFIAGTDPLPWVSGAVQALMGPMDPALFHRVVLGVVVVADLLLVNVRAASLFVATLVQPETVVTGRPGDEGGEATDTRQMHQGMASPAKLGATIGILERLVVVSLVLAGQAAAIGLVVAAKTLARFKQLDDRRFAEYYLLGTLASVAVALITGLVALSVLGPVLKP